MSEVLVDVEKAIQVWEKAFEKKMTPNEKTMFEWGYTYAINDVCKVDDEEVNKDNAIEDLLNSRDDEYIIGMSAMLHQLQENATNCNGKDNCLICEVGNKYLKKRTKELKKKNDVKENTSESQGGKK